VTEEKNIIVISGPSGSGKSTLINKLFDTFDNLTFSVSYTTRKIRKGETEGVNYHYVSEKSFKRMIEKDDFVEWAKVYSNYYGTAWKEIKEKSGKNNILILDIDIQGAKKIKERFSEALMVLISPPSFSELKKKTHKQRAKRRRRDKNKTCNISIGIKTV
jgi:guanylate kinase